MKKTLIRFVALGTLALLSVQTSAQTLTRSQAGRVAVAQCYAQCLELFFADTVGQFRFVLDTWGGEWGLDEEFAMLVSCELSQTSAQAADMCHAGCTDIEAAYDVRTSHIRTRFQHLLNEFLARCPHFQIVDAV